MITREEALTLIREHVKNENIIKHMLALEAVMAGIYESLEPRGKSLENLGGTKKEWMMAGLLHDGDYCEAVPPEKQGIQITEWARERCNPPNGETSIPENVAHAMAAHNWHNTGVEPKNLMDWSIFCADSLTGLVVAACLVLPTKKLADLKVESILKRFREPSFAKGTRREDIALCQDKLGMSLEEFVRISLTAMQEISKDLGL